jgi:hypothetical protein
MTLTSAPRLISAGLVLLDATTGAMQRTIALQYNPDSLSRTFQIQGAGAAAGVGERGGEGGGERAQPFRLKGPAIESIKIEAEIDAIDALEHPAGNSTTTQYGIAPQLALLESLVQPRSADLQSLDSEASSGTLEILAPEAPLTLFVWGCNRIVPVRVTEFSITEEAFDPALNPIRAKVTLGMRVMTTDDLGFAHRGGGIFLNHLRSREALARKGGAATLQSLGVDHL